MGSRVSILSLGLWLVMVPGGVDPHHPFVQSFSHQIFNWHLLRASPQRTGTSIHTA